MAGYARRIAARNALGSDTGGPVAVVAGKVEDLQELPGGLQKVPSSRGLSPPPPHPGDTPEHERTACPSNTNIRKNSHMRPGIQHQELDSHCVFDEKYP